MIYAGAQKNVGPSGVTLVIVREDLLSKAWKTIPSVMDYAVMAENGSMLNTPPTFAIYVAGLVFQWLKRQGGLAEVERSTNTRPNSFTTASTRRRGFTATRYALPTARA